MRAMMIFAVIVVCYGCTANEVNPNYGEIVKFAIDKQIQYPEFTVRFVGKRREMVETYGRDFVYYDFEITSVSESLVASWTLGTGAVAPLLFSIDGNNYFLVLKMNELKTENYILDDDEMIIWPEDVYLQKLETMR
jgi:hypothetical protein